MTPFQTIERVEDINDQLNKKLSSRPFAHQTDEVTDREKDAMLEMFLKPK